tara:strand:- start:42 stop:401 length:360 start_codon:yes stop_codon:yes gene_type:complete
MNMIYFKSWRTWAFMLYILLIIYISSRTANELNSFYFLWKYDKVIHFMEYLGAGFLMINMLMIQPLKKAHWRFAILFLLLFPIIDEMLQYYTPNRIPDIYDAIVDMAGGLFGAYVRKKI